MKNNSGKENRIVTIIVYNNSTPNEIPNMTPPMFWTLNCVTSDFTHCSFDGILFEKLLTDDSDGAQQIVRNDHVSLLAYDAVKTQARFTGIWSKRSTPFRETKG